jgi:hypothetical protein
MTARRGRSAEEMPSQPRFLLPAESVAPRKCIAVSFDFHGLRRRFGRSLCAIAPLPFRAVPNRASQCVLGDDFVAGEHAPGARASFRTTKLRPGHGHSHQVGNALSTAAGCCGSAITLLSRSGAIGQDTIFASKSRNGTCLNFYFLIVRIRLAVA